VETQHDRAAVRQCCCPAATHYLVPLPLLTLTLVLLLLLLLVLLVLLL
jgi:hypothetical protein